MIFNSKALPYVLSFAFLASANSAMADQPMHEVNKFDGTVGVYRLLPVHPDPAHESVVEERLAMTVSRAKLPSSHQIPMSMLPAVRDQQDRGTCAYFSTVGLMEAYYMKKSSNYQNIRLSEECLVDVRNWEYDQGPSYKGADKPADRPDPNGDFPKSIVQTVTSYGVPTAGSYGKVSCTYNGFGNGADVSLTDYQNVFSQYKVPAFGKGIRFDLNEKPTIDDIKALLAQNIPVEIGIMVYNEFFNGSDWRFDAKLDTDGNIAGGHAIQLVGYKTSGSQTIFTFKNSWGPSWGKSGYGTMDDKLVTHSWGMEADFDFIVSMH